MSSEKSSDFEYASVQSISTRTQKETGDAQNTFVSWIQNRNEIGAVEFARLGGLYAHDFAVVP